MIKEFCLFIGVFILFLAACTPYEDPAVISDPRISNPYCNDPSAVNYNWDFPGIADNSTCIYPADIFEGNYEYVDSTLDGNLNVIKTDTFTIMVNKIDSVKGSISGWCAGAPLAISMNKFYKLIIDSLAGDGQTFCSLTDTIIGGGQKSGIQDTSTISFDYILQSDTGTYTHTGTAIKQ